MVTPTATWLQEYCSLFNPFYVVSMSLSSDWVDQHGVVWQCGSVTQERCSGADWLNALAVTRNSHICTQACLYRSICVVSWMETISMDVQYMLCIRRACSVSLISGAHLTHRYRLCSPLCSIYCPLLCYLSYITLTQCWWVVLPFLLLELCTHTHTKNTHKTNSVVVSVGLMISHRNVDDCCMWITGSTTYCYSVWEQLDEHQEYSPMIGFHDEFISELGS